MKRRGEGKRWGVGGMRDFSVIDDLDRLVNGECYIVYIPRTL